MCVTSCAKSFAFLIVLLVASQAVGQPKQDAKTADLTGKVTDEGGEPVAEAVVVLIYKSWPGGRYRQQSLNSKTNKKGEFTFKQLYKTGQQTAFLVSIIKGGFAINSEYVLNRKGERLKPFAFKMAAAKSLTIQLVNKKGKPLAKTPVAPKQRTTPDNNELFLYAQSLPFAQVLTDAEGKVEMSYFQVGDRAEIAVLVGAKPFTASFRVDNKTDRRVTVDIKERVDLTGAARDEIGKAIPNAQVLLIFKSWPGGRYRQVPLQTKTDKDGKFRFPQLHDGGERTAFLVTIVHDGYAMESQYVINQNGAKQDIKFTLPAAMKLKVQLVGENGKPLANASVVPTQRTTADGDGHLIYQQSGPRIAKRTDANGKIDLNLFKAGDSVDLLVTNKGVSSKVSFKVGASPEQVVRVGAAKANQGASRRWAPEAREATPAQIAWIRKSAIPLRSIDPADEDFSDLARLRKLIGDARIVQLGEQSHGDGTCFETKTRLIKFLHQEMGFDVLAFESGLFDCRKAWQEFRQGQPATQAARQGIFGIWTGSRQVQPLHLNCAVSMASSPRWVRASIS